MIMLLIYGGLVTFVFLTVSAGAPYSIFPSNATVTNGEGLVLQFVPAGTPLEKCIIRFNARTLEFVEGNTSSPIDEVKYWGHGLTAGECGIVIETFNSTQHSGNWIFQVFPKVGESMVATSTINGQDANISEEVKLTSAIGQTLLIPCKADDQAYYCTLKDPMGDVVIRGTNCDYNVTNVRIFDIGTWQCIKGEFSTIRETVVNITVSDVESKALDIGTLTDEFSSFLFCNSKKQLTYCRFERPDGTALLLSDGRSNGRYTYYGKGLNSNECGISIQRPLQNEDIGTWVCTLGLIDGSRSGGFMTIGTLDNHAEHPNFFKVQAPESINVLEETSFTLDCSVEAPLDYCWFLHPNGSRFHPHPDLQQEKWKYHGDGFNFGQCGITVENSTFHDQGKWTCGMGVRDEGQISFDLEKQISVFVVETPFVENKKEIIAAPGYSIVIGCHSLRGEALQFCNFLSPNGTGYNVSPRHSRSLLDRFEYYGKGLEYGDCGLLINPMREEDFGLWHCGTLFVGAKDGIEMMRSINILTPEVVSSTAVGVIVGILAVSAVITAAFVIYRRKQKNLTNGSRPVAFSITSDGSEEIVIEVGGPISLTEAASSS